MSNIIFIISSTVLLLVMLILHDNFSNHQLDIDGYLKDPMVTTIYATDSVPLWSSRQNPIYS